MHSKEITLRIRTPLFMGHKIKKEPDKNGKTIITHKALIKATAFKGILRWWFRALSGFEKNDADIAREENELFGSTTKAAPFTLLISAPPAINECPTWNEDEYNGIRSLGTYHLFNNRKPGEYNGLKYFARNLYTYSGKKNEETLKEYFSVDNTFTLRLISSDRDIYNKIQMLFWLSLQFGGFGARSRRCFGNLEIATPEEIKVNEGCFYFKNSYSTIEDYETCIQNNIRLLKDVLNIKRKNNPIFAFQNSHLYISNKSALTWKHTVNYAGVAMQIFRAVSQPDYSALRNITETTKSARAGFGLPLTFRFSQPQGKTVTLNQSNKNNENKEGKEGRLASPVIASVTKIGNAFYSQYLIFTVDYSHLHVKANHKEIKIDEKGVKKFEKFLCDPAPVCDRKTLNNITPRDISYKPINIRGEE